MFSSRPQRLTRVGYVFYIVKASTILLGKAPTLPVPQRSSASTRCTQSTQQEGAFDIETFFFFKLEIYKTSSYPETNNPNKFCHGFTQFLQAYVWTTLN